MVHGAAHGGIITTHRHALLLLLLLRCLYLVSVPPPLPRLLRPAVAAIVRVHARWRAPTGGWGC